MGKITDPDALEWAKKHLLADFKDGIRTQFGKKTSEQRLALYRRAFEELAVSMQGKDLRRFKLFGQLCDIIPPPFGRKDQAS